MKKGNVHSLLYNMHHEQARPAIRIPVILPREMGLGGNKKSRPKKDR